MIRYTLVNTLIWEYDFSPSKAIEIVEKYKQEDNLDSLVELMKVKLGVASEKEW